MENTQAQLNVLALHLSHEHESILDAWRALAESDDTLSPSSHLTRIQFINHIPRILNALCNRFRFWPEDDTPQQRQLELDAVKSHSQHRWQMGYNMRALAEDKKSWINSYHCDVKTDRRSPGQRHRNLMRVEP
jgi:hypothetical protein